MAYKKKTANLTAGYKRLRRSKNFVKIHEMSKKGISASEIAKVIQHDWKDMMDVSREALERQLRRYAEDVKFKGDKALEDPKTTKLIERVKEHQAKDGGWIFSGAEENEEGGTQEGVPENGEGGTTLSKVISGPGSVILPKGMGAIAKRETIDIPGGLQVEDELSSLYKLQARRIKKGIEVEDKIGEVLPNVSLDINLAKEILKTIYSIGGGIKGDNKDGEGDGDNPRVRISVEVEARLKSLGLSRVIQDEKSRKRILSALRSLASLEGGTNQEVLSERVIEGQVIENKGENE